MRTARILVSAAMLVFLSAGLAAKPPLLTPPEMPVLGELEPYLLKKLYETKDVEASLAKICDEPAFKALVAKHKLTLFGGPVLGCLGPTSVKVWLRTPAEARVQVAVGTGAKLADAVMSAPAQTTKARDLTAVLSVEGLKPFTEYTYDVLVDGRGVLEAPLPRFRTAPAKGQKARFDVAFGGGARYNHPKEGIWDTIASHKPAAFLFLGDNVYIDVRTHSGKQRRYYYRRQLRPEYRRMSAGAAIYAIWDDHDFGANDCAGGLDRFKPEWKVPVWRVFQENWPNPQFGGGEADPGCWFDFSIGDVDFFMTDGRYYRAFKQGTMLGPVQKKWLLAKLKASRATFKVIASGTLWTEHADKGGQDSWWGVKAEREEIFSLIDREKIGGVILISADRHRTDVYRIDRPGGYPLYEFETSKLTNIHTHGTRKQALFSYNKGNFFGMLTFDLTKSDPEIVFRCITIENKTVHTMTLKKSQISPK